MSRETAIHDRLARMRQKLAATEDPDVREALADKIAALERQCDVVPVSSPYRRLPAIRSLLAT